MDLLYKELGRRLRKARKKADLTQAALAARVGISRTSITNVEHGNQHVPLHVLFQLAGALGVPAASLLPDESALKPAGSDDEMIQHLKPRARKEVTKLLQQLPEEEREWIYRVMEGESSSGG